jgi:hypothetical protein
MSRSLAILGWLENTSDWLSPIVVKEIRQMARGREFGYAFGISLLIGLAVAFFGAADAASGRGTAGNWTFLTLMACLTFQGLAVVPLGAFSALRNERMEQTLELITLTALSPRRVVIGKLLAQGVKLATLFAVMAPFMAMSFLLGGIDFVTILVSLAVLFLWSLWVSAACLFLSTLIKSRAMSGFVFGGVGVVVILVLAMSRGPIFFGIGGYSGPGTGGWWVLAITTTFCLASLVNLVLLAENRLSLPAENRVTPLRIGFLVQFLLITSWALSFVHGSVGTRTNAVQALGLIGGVHLAVVAMFTVTEGLVLPRRVLLRMKPSLPGRWLLAMFYPGGGRGALYVLVQMALFVGAGWTLGRDWSNVRWLLAICGYICFFTGVPAFAFRLRRPESASLPLRVAVLLLLPAAMILPDVIHYVLWQPEVFDRSYGARHMIDPLRTVANWKVIEAGHSFAGPLGLGLIGLLSWFGLIHRGRRISAQARSVDVPRALAAGGPESAGAAH